MKRFAVALIGMDRPGIVAAATASLLRLRGNVEDVSTSILGGHFAMVLLVAVPGRGTGAELQLALRPLADEGFGVAVWPVSTAAGTAPPTHLLTVYGPDHPGIVHAVADVLARQGVNIQDMACRLHGGTSPVYVLSVEVAIPPGVPPDELDHQLRAMTRPMALEVSLRPIERSDL